MTLSLPTRRGARPQTRNGIPHQQTADNPSSELYGAMRERFLALPGTVVGGSLISVPGAVALFLPEASPCNCEAFFKGREFAHIHPEYDGSFHMILSESDCAHVLEQGWGELHPLAAQSSIQPTVTLVYAPRDDEEIEIVMAIAEASYRYAVGVPVDTTGDSAP